MLIIHFHLAETLPFRHLLTLATDFLQSSLMTRKTTEKSYITSLTLRQIYPQCHLLFNYKTSYSRAN